MVTAWIYILTNVNKTVLYVGSTTNLMERMWQHKTKFFPKSFSAKYNTSFLIYFEEFTDIHEARARETFIKKKTRDWKYQLVNRMNPSWVELDPSKTKSSQMY